MKALYSIVGAVALLLQSNFLSSDSSYDQSSQPRPAQKCGKSDTFQGFEIDAGVGYSGLKLISTRSGLKPLSNTNYGGDGVALQLKVSGSYAFCDMWLVGLEAYGQYNSAETKNRFFETTTSTTATSRTFNLRWNLGLDARVGIAPTCSNLIYVYGGPDWGYYDFHYITTGVDSKHTEFKLGGMVGAGLEQLITDHWFIRASFDYRWYPSETLNYSNGEQQKIKARLGTALFSVGYLF